MRKRSNLETKFDTFMENHWLHMVKDMSYLKGQVSMLVKIVGALFVFVVGVWVVEILR
jgi:hypothetical protein